MCVTCHGTGEETEDVREYMCMCVRACRVGSLLSRGGLGSNSACQVWLKITLLLSHLAGTRWKKFKVNSIKDDLEKKYKKIKYIAEGKIKIPFQLFSKNDNQNECDTNEKTK